MKPKIIQAVLFVIILALSILGLRFMMALKQPPSKAEKEVPGALVRTITVKTEDKTVIVRGFGTVQPRWEASIVPQVSGRVVWVTPSFVAGGIFNKGEKLFEIEKTDYEAALQRAKADLKTAEFELTKSESDAKVARLQWEKWRAYKKKENRLSEKKSEEIVLPPSPLVLFGPQLEKSKAAVNAKKAALLQAERNLEGTIITAPFNCMIRHEMLDLGQFVRAGETIGSLFGTDALEVLVPLALDKIPQLDIPRRGKDITGSKASVRLIAGDRIYTWPGVVDRSLGEVDPKGRMVNVIVRIDAPYQKLPSRRDAFSADSNAESAPELALGMFVEVLLSGKTIRNVVVVPISALRDNNTVWIVNQENRLHIQPIVWGWSTDREIWVTTGLKGGEKVVESALSGVIEGMKLRPISENTVKP